MRCTSCRWTEVVTALLLCTSPLARAEAPPLPTPTLLLELDGRVYPSHEEGMTGFALARLRPGLAYAPIAWLDAKVVVELAGEQPEVLDALVRFLPHADLAIEVGLGKPPLFFTHREPTTQAIFTDVTAVARALRINRDLGVTVAYTPTCLPLEVAARVSNGSSSATLNDNSELAYTLTLDLVLPAQHRGARAPLGLRIGVAGTYESAEDRLGITGRTELGFSYFRAPIVSGSRWVGETHAALQLDALHLLVEAGLASEARSRDDDGNPTTPRRALPASLSYGLSSELGWTFGDTTTTRVGSVDLALRVERLWLGREASDVQGSGAVSATLVAKWWASRNLAATVLATLTDYDRPALDDPTRDRSWGLLARVGLVAP